METFETENNGGPTLESEPLLSYIFDPSVWNEHLMKFADATSLTISLYDRKLVRHWHHSQSSPIAKRLSKAGFWDEGEVGRILDREAARKVLITGQSQSALQLDIFAHRSFPLVLNGDLIGVFVIGWLPSKFADPVLCDKFSKRIQAPPMEIWQIMRMQQPLSGEKLKVHAEMLETFSIPLIRQRYGQLEDRNRALRAKSIGNMSSAFSAATNEPQIFNAAAEAIRKLLPSLGVKIELLYAGSKPVNVLEKIWGKGQSNLVSHLTLPVFPGDGPPIANIEIALEDSVISDDSLHDVNVVCGQLAVALQKVRLISALENERSALKGANTQLHQLHKMKDEFLATVSHELRTPLNAVLGWSQILLEDGPDVSNFSEIMQTIERNAKNQLHLIEDLLDVSRIISGKMVLQRSDLEAGAILKQSVETVFPMTEARRQKVYVQLPTNLLKFKGDQTRVTQIFWNLLSNASKFTAEGGTISVVLEGAGHYFKLSITDSGKGISKEFLPHLFDRFSQADSSFTRRHGGLGLGLAIVRHLVELHGGTVTASSEGEDRGATFTVYLPLNTTDMELDAAHELTVFNNGIERNKASKLKGLKILLIDDEPDSLRLARFVLEKYGAIIECADRAEDGFQKITQGYPDILISDISMPDESGCELIRRIRHLGADAGGDVPAIALSAMVSEESVQLALNAGFNAHVAKPFEPNELVETILRLSEQFVHHSVVEH